MNPTAQEIVNALIAEPDQAYVGPNGETLLSMVSDNPDKTFAFVSIMKLEFEPKNEIKLLVLVEELLT